jgi:16S rRNA (uracil1498-N3)-methyltransferase
VSIRAGRAPILPAVRLPRFFAPAAREIDTSITLPEEEGAHLARVLRLEPGHQIRVFDGRGNEWLASVEQVGRRETNVRLLERVTPAPEATVFITLALAVLKGEKMDAVVRDAVMLGVRAIQPIVTARTELSRADVERSGRVERWQRIAVASAKQCGRAVVPELRPVRALAQVIPCDPLGILLTEPRPDARPSSLRDVPSAPSATVLVGPEGGWTDEELHHAQASGVILLTLGAQTLRADAAPLVALTALRVCWGDF